ncbi:hypothetical protein H6G14_24260 [Nostoc parmelioides FACHB-3921]|uniref:Uncharacterized protein n=2 Tax=Nostoc TaxID=1177 RepID=A0ABR8BM98_9NOSO|nr:hypothetical protein [Nostoc parmelioides FACHB-3921]
MEVRVFDYLFWIAATTLTSLPKTESLIQTIIMVQNTQKPALRLNVNLLEVYETLIPPPGAAKNYPVGHAVVRLRLENSTLNHLNINAQKVELKQADNNKILISQVVQPFNLAGLQIFEQGFYLTNAQGFSGAKKVKAVFTYEFNGKNYSVESPILDVVPTL